MTTQAERRAATREKLITAAREHFARNGFEDTHTGDILKQAGVSRGAMYHHFPSKRDVFEAVFQAVSDETIARSLKKGGRTQSPLEDLISTCLAWLQAARRPDVASILLDQGPQVLGWVRARDLEAEASLSLMTRALERAVDAGEVEVASVDLTARLLNALMAETALAALHRQPPISAAKQEAVIRQFIEGLRAQTAQSR